MPKEKPASKRLPAYFPAIGLLLKPVNNPRRDPPVILRVAKEPRHQVISLNDPPTEFRLDFIIHPSANRHVSAKVRKELVRLVHLRAAQKPASDARTAT
jgi:hypothetical protein